MLVSTIPNVCAPVGSLHGPAQSSLSWAGAHRVAKWTEVRCGVGDGGVEGGGVGVLSGVEVGDCAVKLEAGLPLRVLDEASLQLASAHANRPIPSSWTRAGAPAHHSARARCERLFAGGLTVSPSGPVRRQDNVGG